MKANSFSLSKIIIYDNNSEETINGCYYHGVYTSHTICGEPIQSEDEYCDLFIDNLKKVNTNHIESNQAKQNNFVVFDLNNNYYEQRFILYLNRSYINKITTEIERRENNGENAIIYNKIIDFNNNFVMVKDSEYLYFKTWEEATEKIHNFNNIEPIKEKIEKLKNTESFFYKLTEEKIKRRNNNILFLEDKIKKGFQYMGFNYRATPKTTNVLYVHCYVDHYEPTAEYKRAEKLAKIISDCTHSKIYTNDVIKMLEVLNISIKRTSGKKEEK